MQFWQRVHEEKMRRLIFITFITLIFSLCSLGLSYQDIKIIGTGGNPSNLIFPSGIYFAFNKLFISNFYGNTISILDFSTNSWYEFGSYGEDENYLKNPNSILITNNEKILIVDTGDSLVKVFNFDGNFEFSIGKGILKSPIDIDLFEGKIYISDFDESKIFVFDTINFNLIQQFGNKGNRIGEFNGILGIYIDSRGYLYVCDSKNKRVQIFDKNFKYLKNIEINGIPSDVFVGDDNKIYISDYDQMKIYVYSDLGKSKLNEFKVNSDADWYFFRVPISLFVSSDNYIFYSVPWENRVDMISQDGKYIRSFGEGVSSGSLLYPKSLALSSNGDIFVVDFIGNSVNIFDRNGNYKNSINYAFEHPNGITIDEYDNIYIISRYVGEVVSFDKNLNFRFRIKTFSNNDSFLFPYDIFVKKGKVYIVDTQNNRVLIFSNSGNYLKSFGSEKDFNIPISIFVDDDENIYILEYGNKRVKIYDKNFNLKSTFENLNLNEPNSILRYKNNILILDEKDNLIKIFEYDGKNIKFIKTYGGLGGPLTNNPSKRSGILDYSIEKGKFLKPQDFLIYNNNLYVADSGNRRIQVIPIENLISKPILYLEKTNYELSNIYLGDKKSFYIRIENRGDGVLEGTIKNSDFWINLSSKEIKINPGDKFDLFVEIDTKNLTVGSYNSKITISTNGGDSQILIKFNVIERLNRLTIILWINKPKAFVNDKEVYIDPNNPKVTPFIVPPGRTVVPIRFISETFGADVKWEQDTKTIRINLESKNIKITLQVNNKLAKVNDKLITLDAPPLIKEGRTFVPLRFISEAFGAKVNWFGSEKKIVIEYDFNLLLKYP